MRTYGGARSGRLLYLGATPTFAILPRGRVKAGARRLLWSAPQDASALSGMVPMYLLMSAFHSAPWLKLVSSRRSAERPS